MQKIHLLLVPLFVGALAAFTPVTPAWGVPNCVTPPSGLVSWWRAEGDASDAQGANPGTLVNAVTFAAGEVHQAFSIGGSGTGVGLGNPTNLQLQDFSIEGWIKRYSATKATWDSGALTAGIFHCSLGGYGLGIEDAGRIYLTKVGYGAVFTTNIITDTSSFHHVAVTKSGTQVMLFVDGVAEAAGPYDPGFVFTGPMAIGARGGDYGGSFRGIIDEISIYNRALSVSEVRAIYNANGAGKCFTPPPPLCTPPPSGLVSWWRAEGNALDQAGTDNGTLVGNTAYGAGRVGHRVLGCIGVSHSG
jgi:hypothetical protein